VGGPVGCSPGCSSPNRSGGRAEAGSRSRAIAGSW